MNHTSKIATHNKAIEILELLDKAVKRLRIYENDLYIFNKKDRWSRFNSFYSQSDYEWLVKKGERSVSFISGMYERFMKREFAPINSGFMWPTQNVSNLAYEVMELREQNKKQGLMISDAITAEPSPLFAPKSMNVLFEERAKKMNNLFFEGAQPKEFTPTSIPMNIEVSPEWKEQRSINAGPGIDFYKMAPEVSSNVVNDFFSLLVKPVEDIDGGFGFGRTC